MLTMLDRYWVRLLKPIKHDECPEVPMIKKKATYKCREFQMCVCGKDQLVSFAYTWQKTVRPFLRPSMQLRAVYDRGGLVFQFCSLGQHPLWMAMPTINLTTLVGTVLQLQEVDLSDMAARMCREQGFCLLEMLVEHLTLGSYILHKFMDMFDHARPCEVVAWQTVVDDFQVVELVT